MYNVKVRYFDSDNVQIRFYEKPIALADLKFLDSTGEIFERVRDDGRRLEWNPFTEEWELMQEYDEEKAAHSLRSSGNRSKSCVYDIARANRWDWFVTFTFNGELVERYNYDACVKKLTVWLNNVRKRKATGLKYIVVPEPHKDGAWHFHGLFADCSGLTFSDSGITDKNGRRVYNIADYKLGWCTATRVSSSQKAANYICKYVTKDLASKTAGKKRYWASRNCDKPVEETFSIPGNYMDKLRELGVDADFIKRVASPTGNVITYIEMNNCPDDFREICAKHDVFIGEECYSD